MFYQYLALLVGSLVIINSGMHYAWTSVTLPILQSENSLIATSSEQGSWLALNFFIGTIIGCLVSTPILTVFGRKTAINIASFMFLIAWLMIAFARTFTELWVARLLAGFGDTFTLCFLPAYLAEIADVSIRGVMVTSTAVSITFGMLFVNIIGSYLSILKTALISASLPLIALALLLFVPESPYYLMLKKKNKKAVRSLQKFRNTDNVQEDFERIRVGLDEADVNFGNILDLFRKKHNLKTFLFGLALFSLSSCSGSSSVIIYTQSIFEEVGGISPVYSAIAYLTFQMIIASVSVVFVDKFGRRPLLLISTIGVTAALSVQSLYFYLKNVQSVDTTGYNFISVIALILFAITVNLGLQAIPVLLAGELFATNVKAFALSILQAYYCLVNIFALKIFQCTKDEYGMHVPFLIFTVFSSLGILFTWKFVPETRGKTLEEIQKDLKGDIKCKKTYELYEFGVNKSVL